MFASVSLFPVVELTTHAKFVPSTATPTSVHAVFVTEPKPHDALDVSSLTARVSPAPASPISIPLLPP